MFIHSTERILFWVNIAYFIFFAATLLLSIAAWHFSAKSVREKDDELAKYKEDAKIEISRLNAQSEQAIADAAEANEKAALANERAALLSKEAEDARLEQEKFKAQVAWRTLSLGKLKKMREGIANGSGTVTIAYINNDPESLFLAAQISKAFENTNWQVRAEGLTYVKSLIFEIRIPSLVEKETEILRNAFREAGISFSTEDVPRADMMFNAPKVPSNAMIMIGSKKPPILSD